jgi:DNA-binding MarR family transcriptional regulator
VPQLSQAPAWQSDAAVAAAVLSAVRLIEGRLQVVRRTGVLGGAARGPSDPVVEVEQALVQALCDAGPLSLARLAAHVRLTRRTVTLILTSLARRGLVEMGPSAAGRQGRLVSVTRAGRWSSHRSVDRETAAIERALADWPRVEGQQLAQLLTSLASKLPVHPDG